MKFVSRVCCCFLALGLVACDDPETRAQNARAYDAARESSFAGDVLPFAMACLETFETGSLTTSPMIEAGYKVFSKSRNAVTLNRSIIKDSFETNAVSVTVRISSNRCDWMINMRGDYLATAENAVTTLKKFGYVEVNSNKTSTRKFIKDNRTVELRASVTRSTYVDFVEVDLRLL